MINLTVSSGYLHQEMLSILFKLSSLHPLTNPLKKRSILGSPEEEYAWSPFQVVAVYEGVFFNLLSAVVCAAVKLIF
jgi:hypothetical protein